MDKRYDHQSAEQNSQKLWEKNNINSFNKSRLDKSSDRKIFSIDTPPPTVSGALHIGHIFSYTQTDLIARYKRMRGFNVFYPMGFDDNGLPTERFVEKKHKIRGHHLQRSEFIKLCLKESKEVAEEFAKLWKMMGLSIDWSTVYSTISDPVRKISQQSFLDLYKKDLVYKKEEPALYCTTCQTTVAQAELENNEVSSSFNDIVFKTESGDQLIIATTRPELIPACVAVFYHPTDERYIGLDGQMAITPVFGKSVPILSDELVDKEKGTGLVMCCTFGDQTDVTWYKKHKLPFIQVVGRDGKWTDAAGALAGLRVRDARKKALELLQEEGSLQNQTPIKHSVNTHERCKQEIEYLILNQWFVRILDHKDEFLARAEEIEWKPEFMQARYKDWVENLGWDWCISRQRFYGVSFPVWYCDDCKKVLLAEDKDLPIDPQETQYPGKTCPHCDSTNIVPETDIMDTWNTSSLTPQINCGWSKQTGNVSIPMSLRPQAHDIIRTWTFYTIVKAQYHNNSIPWKHIAISGHVSTGKGKISKSKGGAPTDPENLLKTYSADAIRYWSANGRLGVDTQFSENQFKTGQRLLTKLWNAFRFCSDHIKGYEKPKARPELDALNEWLLHQLSKALSEYKHQFDAYDYTAALELSERFFWNIFCDNYLELIKDQIFNPDKYSKDAIEGTRYALYEVGFAILQMFAPFLPHITEELFQLLFKETEHAVSIHQTHFDLERYAYEFTDSATAIDVLVAIVGVVRKLKSEQNLSLKVELESLTIHTQDSRIADAMKSQEAILKGVTRAKEVNWSVEGVGESKLEKVGELWNAHVMV